MSSQDDPTLRPLDDERLMASGVAGGRHDAHSVRQVAVAVEGDVPHAFEESPLRHGVSVRTRCLELRTLHVDRYAWEGAILAAVVEMQVRMHDPAQVVHIERVLAQRRGDVDAARIERLVDPCVSSRETGVIEPEPVLPLDGVGIVDALPTGQRMPLRVRERTDPAAGSPTAAREAIV